MRGMAYRGAGLTFGEFGLQAMECGRMTAQQIEAARVAMTRHVKRGGKVWIRIFPDKPVTKKPRSSVTLASGKNPRHTMSDDSSGHNSRRRSIAGTQPGDQDNKLKT